MTHAETKALDPDMPAEELRLHMGELTESEVLVARAAIRWANTRAGADFDAQDLMTAHMFGYAQGKDSVTGCAAAPAEDAVEALAGLFATTQRGGDCSDAEQARFTLTYLQSQGYTLRRETMTEEELYSEMKEAMRLKGLRKEVAAIVYAMTAAMKFRG